jgi:hypothetical protein
MTSPINFPAASLTPLTICEIRKLWNFELWSSPATGEATKGGSVPEMHRFI